MLRKNYLKEKLVHQIPVLGTWSIIPSTTSVEILASSGLDFVVLDREHGSVSFENAHNMLIACENQGVSPLIRVSDLTLSEVQRALDLGVHGIHVPNVESIDQVEALVQYAKYPPIGKRGFSPFTRAAKYSAANAKDQFGIANQNSLIIVHVEGEVALQKLDQLLRVPELDVIFLGLFDLSKSLGIPGQVEHPEIKRHLIESVRMIRQAGKIAGCIASKSHQIEEFLNMGINYITFSVDCNVLYDSYLSISQSHKSCCNQLKNLKECSWN